MRGRGLPLCRARATSPARKVAPAHGEAPAPALRCARSDARVRSTALAQWWARTAAQSYRSWSDARGRRRTGESARSSSRTCRGRPRSPIALRCCSTPSQQCRRGSAHTCRRQGHGPPSLSGERSSRPRGTVGSRFHRFLRRLGGLCGAPIANAHTDYQPRTGGKRARAHRQVSAANADSPQDSLAARAYWAVALGRHRGPRPATADETATPSSRTRERGVTAWSAHNARALAGSEAHAGGALSHTHACAQTLNEATPTTHAHNTNGTRAHAYGPQRHEGAITPITRHA